MFIKQGDKGAPINGKKAQPDLLTDQTTIMRTLLGIAFCCVPLMLLVRPCWESRKPKHTEVADEGEGTHIKTAGELAEARLERGGQDTI